jgi:UDP-N-acetylglucosamine--N-acetylmuramyl-(pentapeptide) pyrophosphoryl-undecaprenol N-acetylglucosamine transferase
MKKTIVLAAGGTGGHIFPAEALAKKLAQEEFKVVLITDRASQKFQSLPSSVQVMVLPLKRRSGGLLGKFSFCWGLIKSLFHAVRGLRAFKPSVVVGFGGYPSFPALIAARFLKIPTIVQEQNSVLGQVNRWLGKKSTYVALSYENTKRADLIAQKIITGTPVRPEFYAYRDTTYTPPTETDKINVLITGGSQGAAVFSDIIPQAFSLLTRSLQDRLKIVHQCPKMHIDRLKTTYANYSFRPKITDFISNMAKEISEAHIVISRSGASTLAELQIVGRPVVMIPFLQAKDDHQWYNAKSIENKGGGWCIHQSQFTPETLSSLLEMILQTPAILNNAALRMKDMAHVNALEELVNIIRKTV